MPSPPKNIRIVSEGANYVASEFAWDSAGYFWDSINLNAVVDGLRPGNASDVDRVTDVVNSGKDSVRRDRRRSFYTETILVIY